jgi:uncharacterized RDD family membrane protein YckC
MHCKHCGFANGEDDHRCLRCGRRLSGVVIAAPPGYSGANALAQGVALSGDTTEEFLAARNAALLPGQQPLFASYSNTDVAPPVGLAPNVIPFDRLQRQALNRVAAPAPGTRTAPPQPATRKSPVSDPRTAPRASQTAGGTAKMDTLFPKGPQPARQETLDFIPGIASKGRKLKTDVDAQVFCDQPVATPTHRCVASAIDAAMITLGFGVVVITFQSLGGSFGQGKMLWIGMGAVLALVSMLYGLIWAIAGRETPGMHFADLQLITFDGFPLDPRSRALRFASTWLSFCSGGVGLLWAVADEENLTWHDHISKTFPTIREVPGTFVRQRT